MHAYGFQRRLTYAGLVSRFVYANNGIVAGCMQAMFLVMACVLQPMDHFVLIHSSVDLLLHVNDFSISAEESDDVIEPIVGAGRDLLRATDQELEAVVSVNKTRVVASRMRDARVIAERLKLGAASNVTAASLLGCDCRAGGKTSIKSELQCCVSGSMLSSKGWPASAPCQGSKAKGQSSVHLRTSAAGRLRFPGRWYR